MIFNIISIFPEAFESYFDVSIIKRAQEKKLIKIKFFNPRDFAADKHKIVDDKPYGGGPGMVMKAEPILKAMSAALSKSKIKSKIILLSPRGKQFTQKMARGWAEKYKNIILICGHYEGVDERVKKITAAEKVSIGSYILTGGEIPAMVVVDAVSRHIPGVLGKKESLEENRLSNIRDISCQKADKVAFKSFPAYTRPEILKWKGRKYRVPKVLLSGDHKKIESFRTIGELRTSTQS